VDNQTYELSLQDIAIPPVDSETPHQEGSDASVIGQPRAMAALSLGLGISAKGYNIFIQGAPGTGRRTALLRALSDYTVSTGIPQDITFVSNFSNPLEPRALVLPPGKAKQLKQEIHELVEDIKRLVALHQESQAFKEKKEALVSDLEQEENHTLTEFESQAAAEGFQIVQLNDGDNQSTDLLPLRKGKPTSFEDLQGMVAAETLSTEEWNQIREKYYALMDRMKTVFDTLKKARIDLDKRISDLQKEMLGPLVQAQIGHIKTALGEIKVIQWLDELAADIVSHIFLFTKERIETESRRRKKSSLSRYGINIVVDRSEYAKPPIIFENHPSMVNLVGSIDPTPGNQEDPRTAYLRIRGGSILKAAGGILVLRAEDILEDEEAWPYLKRVLQTGIVEIQSSPGPFGPSVLIKPEALEISLKVVIIGGELSYDLLYQTDADFQKLFKICAEFDSVMDKTPQTVQKYIAFLRKLSTDEGLQPLDSSGIGEVLVYSMRDAEHRQKLSTRFSLIADLLREADWWARGNNKTVLDAQAIRRAVEMRSFLHRLPEDNLEGMILSDEIIVQLTGSAVGKANGLAVHDRGYFSYGIPVVVSAKVAPGDGGVINIEGESGLSGEIFDKAVLILSGYLRSRYARAFPLSITASVCFEQMYTPIDGDSATAVQLCAILSAISGIPLRQDLAMTGSVNQLGDVQPVGGVSEKIEGFHSICVKKGLTGTQGVVIPWRNRNQLILSPEVERDIQRGVFHIYAVHRIDEALELFADRPAGILKVDGTFDNDTVNGIVSQELRRMADVIRNYET
jgi:lon-related putative ATP-dependent protease